MSNSNCLPRRDANAADFKTQNINNRKVTKYTRAGKYGKAICCPECDNIQTVYHFSWSGLTCLSCKQSVDKYDWRVITTQGQFETDSDTEEEQSYVDSLLTAGTN